MMVKPGPSDPPSTQDRPCISDFLSAFTPTASKSCGERMAGDGGDLSHQKAAEIQCTRSEEGQTLSGFRT